MAIRAGLFHLTSIFLFTVNCLGAAQNTPSQLPGKISRLHLDPALSQKAKSASDASKAVESAVTASQRLCGRSSEVSKEYCGYHGADKKRTALPLDDLQTIQATVSSHPADYSSWPQDLIDTLSKDKDAWTEVDHSSRSSPRNRMQCPGPNYGQQQATGSVDASAECVKAQQQAQDELKSLGDAISGLQGALQGIYKYFQTQVAALGTSLKSLSDLVPPILLQGWRRRPHPMPRCSKRFCQRVCLR